MAHAKEFIRLVEEAKSGIKEATVEEIWEKLEKGDPLFFVDVREDDEWKAGRARGAQHLGKGIIERDIESKIPDKAATVVLYCGGGFRSALAAESIKKMGYQNVISMDGGIRRWRELGLPEETE